MLAVIYLTYRYRDGLRVWRHESVIRWVLAFALILSEMSYYWRLVGVPSLGPNPVDHLPITVCGWAVVFCSYMIVTKSLSGTVFALAYLPWYLKDRRKKAASFVPDGEE